MSSDDVHRRGELLYSPLVEAAIRLAARGHYNQFRKRAPDTSKPTSGELPLSDDHIPYITHLMGTVCILARLGAADQVLAAAALHDYLEDVPDPDGPSRIRALAGDEVLELVLAVTEDKRPERDRTETWELRKREQVERLATMPEAAVLIKCADLLHNLSSLEKDLEEAADPHAVWARFNADRTRQMWYYSSLVSGARRRIGPHPLVDEIERVLGRLPE
ncbi:MAG TPA: HD domain-containing protein [Methylomirabilota bacterium]|nr:HD domain-containing protein [Methylomirabilota bacterium]